MRLRKRGELIMREFSRIAEAGMAKRKPIYEGKAKVLFEGPEPGTLVQHFKDDATAFNGEKHGTISGKGVINNRISEYLMTHLGAIGIPTHFIKSLNMREQLVYKVEVIPIEFVVRNIAAGSLAKRLGIPEGQPLPRPILEFYYKDDNLGDPMITEEHIYSIDLADMFELEEIKIHCLRINDFLSGMFAAIGIRLVDFKLEFGRYFDEDDQMRILLADEISPDSCRLWDFASGEKLDKDRFRRDLGNIEAAYQEVAKRLGVLPDKLDENVTPFSPKPKEEAKVEG